MGGGASGLGRTALDAHAAGHHVFRNTDAGVAVHGDAGFLVHARAVVTGVPLDIDGHGLVHANGEVVLAVGVGHHPFAVFYVVHLVMQRLVEVAHAGDGKIDGFHVCAP
ncbi:hypothetical protein D3C80_1806290 [compost metagenome]